MRKTNPADRKPVDDAPPFGFTSERPVVLAVDDEPQILAALVDTLEEECVVHTAPTADEAMALIPSLPDLSVLLSDQRMPGMCGDELLARARQISRAAAVMVTGYADLDAVVRAVNEGRIFGYITKPWNQEQLLLMVHSAHSHYRLQRELMVEQRLLRELMDNTTDLVFYQDRAHRFIRANRQCARVLDCEEPEALIGRTVEQLLPKEAVPALYDAIENERVLQTGQPSLEHCVSARLPGTNEWRWFSTTRAPIRNDRDEVVGVVGISRDVTDRLRYQAELERHANFDSLTEVANRSLLTDRLSQGLTAASRYDRTLAVLSIGIDRFGGIVSSFGHAVGDAILKQAATRIRALVPEGDTVARAGASEFAVVLSTHQSVEAIAEHTRRILDALAAPYVVEAHDLILTASAGVSLYSGDEVTPAKLLQHAYIARVQARSAGGNQYCFDTPAMNAAASQRLALYHAMHGAVERNEFMLQYQPRVSLRDGAIVGMEALLRWQHPRLGIVPPLDFISLAEDTGMILQIGEWAVREACRQIRAWQDAGLCVPPVAVNLSPRQFRSSQLRTVIAEALAASAVDASLLELEITEGTAMTDVEDAVRVMAELKALGVSLALDDFGTGYSSLAYLKRFPIDCIKIDRAFVRDVTSEPNDAAICLATIQLAHSLRLKVIAEGVEGDSQAAYLRRRGCDEMQGFLFSRPVNPDRVAEMLRRGERLAISDERGEADQPTLLLVDDEPHVLAALRRTLRGERYRVMTATSAHEGLEILAKHLIHVLISDERMPGMSGSEFLTRVKDLHPRTVRMVLSGYAHIDSITRAINDGAISKFLLKPWDDEEIRVVIREAFARFARDKANSVPD